MTLKRKTISGLIWGSVDSFANQGIQFIVGLILARILSPREFGLVGMLTIFIAISQAFIESGFTSALIRKKDCTQEDYSTIFYFNILSGIFFYLLLILFSGIISSFFNEPQLKILIIILGIGLILNSLSIVQRTILTKELNFKLQMKVSIVSSVGSGILAIVMAYYGFGVWSLIALTLSRFGLNSLFLWLWTQWVPSRVFSKASFKELFSFGSKLMISGLIDTVYRNVYNLVIGKYFSAIELGYYSMADQFQAMPSQNLSSVVGRVSYPVFSMIQEDSVKLKSAYRRVIKSTMLVTFVFVFGMIATAEPLISTLIGEKWISSVIYLQLLCFAGMIYPLHAINLNVLQLKGRSDLFLRVEIIKKLLVVPVVVIGVLMGIKVMIYGIIIINIISYFINSYWSGEFVGYSSSQQLKDIFPSFLLAVFVGIIIYSFGSIIHVSNWLKLLVQILTGAILTITIAESIKLVDYIYLKEIIIEKIFKKQ